MKGRNKARTGSSIVPPPPSQVHPNSSSHHSSYSNSNNSSSNHISHNSPSSSPVTIVNNSGHGYNSAGQRTANQPPNSVGNSSVSLGKSALPSKSMPVMNNNSSGMMTNSVNSNNVNSGLPASQASMEGAYLNLRLTHATTSLTGCIVQVQTRTNEVFEGVYDTFSPEFEIVLDNVISITKGGDKSPPPETKSTNPASIENLASALASKKEMTPKMIFSLDEVVKLKAVNVLRDYATSSTDFKTDTEISKAALAGGREKELVPWDGDCGDGADLLDENGLHERNASNGWDANDMFRLNEEKYNLTTDYHEDLTGYTLPLVAQDTEEYRKREAEANRLASEIEKNTGYQTRISKEAVDGDEEEQFSAVIRPVAQPSNSASNPPASVTPNNERDSPSHGPFQLVKNQSMNDRRRKATQGNNYSQGGPGGPTAGGGGRGRRDENMSQDVRKYDFRDNRSQGDGGRDRRDYERDDRYGNDRFSSVKRDFGERRPPMERSNSGSQQPYNSSSRFSHSNQMSSPGGGPSLQRQQSLHASNQNGPKPLREDPASLQGTGPLNRNVPTNSSINNNNNGLQHTLPLQPPVATAAMSTPLAGSMPSQQPPCNYARAAAAAPNTGQPLPVMDQRGGGEARRQVMPTSQGPSSQQYQPQNRRRDEQQQQQSPNESPRAYSRVAESSQPPPPSSTQQQQQQMSGDSKPPVRQFAALSTTSNSGTPNEKDNSAASSTPPQISPPSNATGGPQSDSNNTSKKDSSPAPVQQPPVADSSATKSTTTTAAPSGADSSPSPATGTTEDPKVVTKSKLNPNAKEFVFTPRAPVVVQAAQPTQPVQPPSYATQAAGLIPAGGMVPAGIPPPPTSMPVMNPSATPPSASHTPASTPSSVQNMNMNMGIVMQGMGGPHHHVRGQAPPPPQLVGQPGFAPMQPAIPFPYYVAQQQTQYTHNPSLQQMAPQQPPLIQQTGPQGGGNAGNANHHHQSGHHSNKHRGPRGQSPYANHGGVRQDYSIPSSAPNVAAATGAPVHAGQVLPMSGGPGQMVMNPYPPHSGAGLVAGHNPNANHQNMYQHMGYQNVRMNIPQTVGIVPGYDQNMLYLPMQLPQPPMVGQQQTVQVSQAGNMMGGGHSAPSTPQSQTPNTPLHIAPAPSPHGQQQGGGHGQGHNQGPGQAGQGIPQQQQQHLVYPNLMTNAGQMGQPYQGLVFYTNAGAPQQGMPGGHPGQQVQVQMQHGGPQGHPHHVQMHGHPQHGMVPAGHGQVTGAHIGQPQGAVYMPVMQMQPQGQVPQSAGQQQAGGQMSQQHGHNPHQSGGGGQGGGSQQGGKPNQMKSRPRNS